MKSLLYLFLLSITLYGCCDDCGELPPPPCNQVIIGSVKNSEEMKNIQPFRGQIMVFKNASSYTLNYKSTGVTIDSSAGLRCDTTFYYERRRIDYVPDKISPKIKFEIGYIMAYQDSFVEVLTVTIGNFKAELITNRDTLISLFKSEKVKYYDSTKAFNTKLRAVYHVQNLTAFPNEINGFYYSISLGLLAFYIDDNYYWVKQ